MAQWIYRIVPTRPEMVAGADRRGGDARRSALRLSRRRWSVRGILIIAGRTQESVGHVRHHDLRGARRGAALAPSWRRIRPSRGGHARRRCTRTPWRSHATDSPTDAAVRTRGQRRQSAIPHLAPQHLADERLRQLVDDEDAPGNLVRRSGCSRAKSRIASTSTSAPAASTIAATTSSPRVRARQPDDGGVLDLRVLTQRVLDLGRCDVEAAGDDELLDAVDDPHEAGVVDRDDVAGAEPAVDEDSSVSSGLP